MEKMLDHSTFLSNCYQSLEEARARDAFIESFKHELDLVKFANFHDLLARKSSLLDASLNLGFTVVCVKSRVVNSTK